LNFLLKAFLFLEMRLLVVALFLAFLGYIMAKKKETVVGVLTFPVDEDASTTSYIKVSYIEYLMAGGARVVPILYNATQEEVEATFEQVNGVLFTGGPKAPMDFPTYFATASLLYDLSLRSYEEGENPVPLWGTCLGFETIATIQDLRNGHDGEVLSGFDAEKISLPLTLTPQAFESKLFGGAPRQVIEAVRSEAITTNWHSFGVSPFTFAKRLQPELVPLSVNEDRESRVFVSALEHSQAFIFATQFHPEANAWDDDDLDVIDRSKEAMLVA
jgi:gamma-glutamyl hydrolase